MMLLKYLSNFWINLGMPLINCEVTLILNFWTQCVISSDVLETKTTMFAKTDAINVSVVTQSTQDNAKQSKQLKSCFKRPIKWKKYQPGPIIQTQDPYFLYFIDPRS